MARASTVAVVVPSPATSEVFDATSFTICAPMFSNLSSSWISLATVTPSLVTVGAPQDFSMTTLRPLGPSVTVTASASSADAAQDAVAGIFAELHDLCSHCRLSPSFVVWSNRLYASMHAEDVVLAHDHVLFAVELDLGAGVLAEEDAVARLDVRLDDLAVLAACPARPPRRGLPAAFPWRCRG